jgi:anaerobic magnesium-protoporphyrin IX monomethyl ester cyclase
MKVLLVEPPRRTWEVMGNYVSPPLGLAYLAAVLETAGIELDILDCNASKIGWSALGETIEQLQPNIIGAAAITPSFYEALRVMEIAKKISPGIVTVLGGPHVTFTPEETLTQCPEIDVIVRGEGEQTLLELVRCYEKGGNLSQVEGIAFRDGQEPVLTPPQPLVNVDELPLPAYHLLPMEKYHFNILGKFATILSSRGCPHKCTFCAEWRFWGGKWRPRNPKKIVDEIELLHKRYGRECFWFGDDCFNVDAERIQEICSEIMARKLDISWFYQGRADLVIKHKDLLPQMRRSGNLMAQIGVESSTNKELEEFNKNLTMEQIKEAIDLLQKHDIVAQGLQIIGTRRDSADSIAHKLRCMKWLDPAFPIFTMFTPFPGSDVYEEAKANGWLETLDYSLYDMSYAIMPTEYLSRKQLMPLYYGCFKSYYLDPLKIIKGLASRNSWKRKIWRHMLKYTAKQMARSFR